MQTSTWDMRFAVYLDNEDRLVIWIEPKYRTHGVLKEALVAARMFTVEGNEPWISQTTQSTDGRTQKRESGST